MDRAEKERVVASLHQLFTEANVLVITHQTGLNVALVSDLRGRMRDAGAKFKVTKNRLTRLALKDTQYEDLAEMFVGPTAIAYSDDPVAAPKVASEFAKQHEQLVILGGGMGETRFDPAGIDALAKLPSLDGLRSMLVGLISSPATKIAGVLAAPAGQLARVVGAYATKDEAA